MTPVDLTSSQLDKSWMKPTILLCLYGLFLYVKPSEPFLTPYLMGPVHNLTEEEVVNEIYPVWTYSYLPLLLPVFLLTDYLKYKPIIIFQGMGHIACWLLLLFGRGVPLMQLMQVCYAVATAGEVGYFSYIYSIVDESHYQRVTSYVRSTTLFGIFIGSLLAQFLVSFVHRSYFYLNVISLVDVSIAFVISWFLPMPKSALFFASKQEKGYQGGESSEKFLQCNDDEDSLEKEQEVKPGTSLYQPPVQSTLRLLYKDVKLAYLNPALLRWSIWWALSTCGWLLVVNYMQNLWETIRPSSEHDVYNGAVESLATVMGGIGAFLVAFINVDWSKWGELSLGFFSLVKCALLMLMYWTTNIWLCYSAYVIFICLYNVVITITQFQIAVGLSTRRVALVFGVNTFAALALNTTLTVILIDKRTLNLNVNTQFIVYSVYFGLVAILFLCRRTYSLCNRGCHDYEARKVIVTSPSTQST